MAGVRISREKGSSRGLGPFWEIQKISAEFSFMVLDYNSYVKVAILGNLCGGVLSGPPRARISGEKGQYGCLGRVSLGKKLSLDGWGAYFSRKRLIWAARGVYFSRKR